MQKRKSYTREFKLEAVRLLGQSGTDHGFRVGSPKTVVGTLFV